MLLICAASAELLEEAEASNDADRAEDSAEMGLALIACCVASAEREGARGDREGGREGKEQVNMMRRNIHGIRHP
jgi:hypothetical protein